MTLSDATTPGLSGPGSDDMKLYSALPKASASLEPHHQVVLCYIQNTRWLWWWWWGLTPLQRCRRCILQPQPTGQTDSCVIMELSNKWANLPAFTKRCRGSVDDGSGHSKAQPGDEKQEEKSKHSMKGGGSKSVSKRRCNIVFVFLFFHYHISDIY